jgi:hypothetical protein
MWKRLEPRDKRYRFMEYPPNGQMNINVGLTNAEAKKFKARNDCKEIETFFDRQLYLKNAATAVHGHLYTC